MDNNEVYALFEDIKNDLKGINGKLENAPKVTNNQSGGQPPAVDLKPIKELFDSFAKEHQAQTKAMLTKFGEAEVYASNRILGLLRNLKESFVKSSEERKDEPQKHIHRHSFDIRSSKVFSLLVGMGIVCSLSIWGNIELWKSKWKSHATLTLLAKQDLPTFGYNMIAPLKSWCWGSILFYPFKISRFS